MKAYYNSIGEDPFKTLPLTFMVKEGITDHSFEKFKEYYYNQSSDSESIWIVKPGEGSARGEGIQVMKDIN